MKENAMIHNISLRCYYFFLGLIFLIFLSGCKEPGEPLAIATSVHPTATASRMPPSATPTSTPGNTPTPTDTPTPSGADPNWGPAPEGALVRLGKGEPMGLAISPDGQFIAVGSPLGVFLYRMDTHALVWSQTEAGADDVAYSADGQWVAAAGGLNVLLLDAATGNVTLRWQVPDDADVYFRDACEVTFSPDGNLLASISANGKITLWDITDGNMKRILQNDSGGMSYPCGLAFSPDGTIIASAVGSDLTLFNPSTAQVLQSMRGEPGGGMGFEAMNDVSFSPDGKTIVTGNGVLWDVQSGQEILRLEYIDQGVMAFSPDGKTIASDSYDRLTLWDAASGGAIWSIEHSPSNEANDLKFLPDGQSLAVAFSSESIVLLDSKTGERRDSIQGHFYTMSLTFSKDSNYLASWDWAEIVRVWDVNSHRLVHTFMNAEISSYGKIQPSNTSQDLMPGVTFVRYIEGQATSANGKIRAIGDDEGVIHLQDAYTGLSIKDLVIPGDYNPVHDLALSSDGKTLAAFDSSSGSTWFWDVGSEDLIGYLENSGWGIAYSPNAKYLATVAGDGSIYLWDITMPLPAPPQEALLPTPTPEPTFAPAPTPTPPPSQAIYPNADSILGLAFGSDNARLTILAAEGVYTYRGGGLQEQWRWPSPVDRSLASLSPDGKLVAVVVEEKDRKSIDLWDTNIGRRLRSLSADNQEYLYALQFSPDSSRLAASAGDGQVVIWDVNSGQITRTLSSESGWQYLPDPPHGLDLAFSPDGETLSAGYGPGLTLWNVQTGTQTVGETLCRGDTTYDQVYTPDGRTVLFACGPFNYPLGFLSFWDVPEQRLSTYWDECGSIHSLAYSPDAEMAAFGYYDGWLELWAEEGQPISWLGHGEPSESWYPWDEEGNLIGAEHEVTALAFSTNGKRLASGSLDGSVIIWDLSSLKLAPSPSGCTLRIGQEVRADENARLWSHPDASRGEILSELIPGQSLYVLSGPVYGPVLRNRSLSDWFWEVSLTPDGESAGWIWQDRVEECQ
jgi:WD40 repeat protein